MLRLRAVLAVLMLAAVLVAFRSSDGSATIFRYAGHALVAEDPLERADIIVVPFWAGGEGVLTAVDLIHAGVASRAAVLMEPPTHVDAELARRGVPFANQGTTCVRLFKALGIDNVQTVDGGPGTSAQSEAIAAWSDANHFRTIVVVSTPDHSARFRRLLRRSLKNHQTRAIVTAARFAEFDPDHWWQNRDGIRTEIEEFEKLLLDVAAHPLS